MPSFDVTWDGVGRPFNRRQKVFVVVRHTRSGDKRVAVVNDDSEDAIQYALKVAENVANMAGSASVFRGTLIVSKKEKALQP